MSHGSGFITLWDYGGFSTTFRVKSNGKQTDSSRVVNAASSASWSYDELYNYGFRDGDDCWVSADIEGGVTNHESGQNFTFSNPLNVQYHISGGLWNPSWNRD
ncbi:hypothetical protein LTR47_012118, partial [Exophiala xenobiotica]